MWHKIRALLIIFLTSSLSFCIPPTVSQPKWAYLYLPSEPHRLDLKESECPPISIFEKSENINDLALLVQNIEKSTITQKTIPIVGENRSLQLVECRYTFKQNSKWVGNPVYQVILLKPSNTILWGPLPTDAECCYLSDWKLCEIYGRWVLELQFYTGRIGDYWQDFFILGEDSLTPIEKDFIETSESLIPAGYTRKDVNINLIKGIAEISLTRDNKINTQSFAKLILIIKLENNKFNIISSTFQTSSK